MIDSINDDDDLYHEANIEQQENDIHRMIEVLEGIGINSLPYNSLELDSYGAQREINKAQRKIRELQLEIEKQELIIHQAERTIRSYKRQVQLASAAKGRGRPESSEFSVSIGKKFVSKWVISLMEALDVKSCKKLEDLICPEIKKLKFDRLKMPGGLDLYQWSEINTPSMATERNWRRWLKGEAIPNYNTFVNLMHSEIDFGKYKGQLLQDIPTTPSSNDLQTLLRFI